jgi:hypothetical protein
VKYAREVIWEGWIVVSLVPFEPMRNPLYFVSPNIQEVSVEYEIIGKGEYLTTFSIVAFILSNLLLNPVESFFCTWDVSLCEKELKDI